MKTKPAGSILQSQQLQKQTFVFTNADTSLGQVRLNTSFDLGTITNRGIKLSQTRYHLTSSVLPDPADTSLADVLHFEVTVRHHPKLDGVRLGKALDILLPLLAKDQYADEILTPGLFTGSN